MVSNKVKRNISLVLTVIGIGILAARIIDFATGGKFWPIVSALVIDCMALKIYLAYRKAVRDGNLFNKVNPFR